MLLFWERGYGATSLQDLLAAMAISRSSFYAAFGDKRSLYREVLSLFAERNREILTRLVADEEPLQAVTRFFQYTLFDVPERRMRRGCLLVNTVLELAGRDSELNALAAAGLDHIERAFEDCFREAIDAGRLDSAQDPQELARFIMTLNQGLRVASRKNTSREALDGILATTLSLLPLAA